jgi:putative oxidoreductase
MEGMVVAQAAGRIETPLPWLSLLARLVVGSAFIAASIDKIADPASFAASIGYYRLVPHGVALTIATILPWLELLCGVAVLAGVTVRTSSALSFLMLAVFTAAVASAVARGLDISCGCFTQDPAAGKIGLMKFAENGALLLLSAFLYIVPGSRWSLERYILRHQTP